MTDWREELIEKMARAMCIGSDNWTKFIAEARVALALAEPVIREREDNALREENARLREVLAPFVDAGNFKVFISTASTEEECFVSINVKERDLRRARAAIREGGK